MPSSADAEVNPFPAHISPSKEAHAPLLELLCNSSHPPESTGAPGDRSSPLEVSTGHCTVSSILPSGRRVLLSGGETERLVVHSPDGQVELTVRFSPDGPVLTFASAELELVSPRTVSVDCRAFQVRAAEEIRLEAAGDLTQVAAGRHLVRAGAAATTEAHSVDIRSRRGDVRLKANDDVRIDGERVLLNS